jgi:hypothetical protein
MCGRPAKLLMMVFLDGWVLYVTTEVGLEGPLKNPRSMWNLVPGRNALFGSAFPLAALSLLLQELCQTVGVHGIMDRTYTR